MKKIIFVPLTVLALVAFIFSVEVQRVDAQVTVSVSVSDTKAILGSPVTVRDIDVAYPFSFEFTINNSGKEDVYISAIPEKMLRLKYDSEILKISISPEIKITPQQVAGDSGTDFVILSGTSRKFVINGGANGLGEGYYLRSFRVTGINYKISGDQNLFVLEKGLENLSLGPVMSGVKVPTVPNSPRAPFINVVSPVGGNTYAFGANIPIMWESTNVNADYYYVLLENTAIENMGIVVTKNLPASSTSASFVLDKRVISALVSNSGGLTDKQLQGKYYVRVIAIKKGEKFNQAVTHNISGKFSVSLGTVTDTSDPTDKDLPFITSVTPSAGPVGSMIEIKGRNLSGFEGDLDVVFERNDGKKIILTDKESYRRTGGAMIRVIIKEPCKQGETIYGRYSGIPFSCDYVEFTPGTYKVYVRPWARVSNVVKFVVLPNWNSTTTSVGENNQVIITDTKATLGSPIISQEKTVAHGFSFELTINNMASSSILIPTNPEKILRISKSDDYSNVVISSRVDVKPMELSGDSDVFYVIPAGSSRKFVLRGMWKGVGQGAYLRTIRTTGLYYKKSINSPSMTLIEKGLENLSLSAVIEGIGQNASSTSASYPTAKPVPEFRTITVKPPVVGIDNSKMYIKVEWTPYSRDFDYYQIILGNTNANAEIDISEGRKVVGQLSYGTSALDSFINRLSELSGYSSDAMKNAYYIKVNAIKADAVGGMIVNSGKSALFTIATSSARINLNPSQSPYITPLQPTLSYVQAPASNVNQLYAGQRAIVYGTNLNTDISVRLIGKTSEDRIPVYNKTNNSASFNVPSGVLSGSYVLSIVYKEGETKRVMVQVISPTTISSPTPYYSPEFSPISTPSPTPYSYVTPSPIPVYSSTPTPASPSIVPTPTPVPTSSPTPSSTTSPTPVPSTNQSPSVSPSPSSSPTVSAVGGYDFQAALWTALLRMFSK